MTRCGIERLDGLIRIGILCDDCAVRAMKKLEAEGRRFWASQYNGTRPCEACQLETTPYNEGDYGDPH